MRRAMSFTALWPVGLLALCLLPANAQTYWSANPNLDCTGFGDANGKPMKVDSSAYVCYVYGTLPWYTAGSDWGSVIRVAAPPSAPVAYFFDFAGENGAAATLDFLYQGDSIVHTGTSAGSALYANQPLEVTILGRHSEAVSDMAASGPVVVLAECPDRNTCSQVQAQLILSAQPAHPWSLSAPVIWDWQTSYGWSVVGTDDGAADMIAFVIYNIDTLGQVPHTYTLNVYDAAGSLYATATTKPVPLYGSYADLLRSVMTRLPSGAFKLQLVGPAYSAFEVLQFHGPSATALTVASEVVPAVNAASTAVRKHRDPPPAARQLALPRITW